MLARFRHSYLLASLMLLLFAYPFVGDHRLGDWSLRIVLVGTMVTSILACAERRREIVIGCALVAAQQAVDVFGRPGPRVDNVMSAALGFLVFAYVTVLMLRRIFGRTGRVTTDTIAGSISAYLLLGVTWSFAYTLLELAEPGSFMLGDTPVSAELERCIGFSFITLTTLGYGNVAPATERADVMCSTQAILGQVYLTVLVARLVALHMAQSQEVPPSEES